MPVASSEPSVPSQQETAIPQEAQTQTTETAAPSVAQPEVPAETSNNVPVDNQAQPATQENNGSLKDSFNSGIQNVKEK